jgi:hypothetical protein
LRREGVPFRVIADRLGMSLGAVQKALRRAQKLPAVGGLGPRAGEIDPADADAWRQLSTGPGPVDTFGEDWGPLLPRSAIGPPRNRRSTPTSAGTPTHTLREPRMAGQVQPSADPRHSPAPSSPHQRGRRNKQQLMADRRTGISPPAVDRKPRPVRLCRSNRIRRDRIWRVTGKSRCIRYHVVRQHASDSTMLPIIGTVCVLRRRPSLFGLALLMSRQLWLIHQMNHLGAAHASPQAARRRFAPLPRRGTVV